MRRNTWVPETFLARFPVSRARLRPLANTKILAASEKNLWSRDREGTETNRIKNTKFILQKVNKIPASL